VLRSARDFEVDEILGFAAGGEGACASAGAQARREYQWVARELARAAGVKPFEVGFAGLRIATR
jgi:tRNA pseudouridine13 synthase